MVSDMFVGGAYYRRRLLALVESLRLVERQRSEGSAAGKGCVLSSVRFLKRIVQCIRLFACHGVAPAFGREEFLSLKQPDRHIDRIISRAEGSTQELVSHYRWMDRGSFWFG